MEHEPNVVRVGDSSQRPRGPSIIVAAFALFLLLALVKPWSFGGSGSGGAASTPDPGASDLVTRLPAPSPMPTTTPDPNAMPCLAGDVEQVVAIERWPGNEVRSWIATDDATVSGPLDPRLARIVIYSTHVLGVGICASRALGGGLGAGAWIRDVQAIVPTSDGPKAIDLGSRDSISGEFGAVDAAVLYGPPSIRVGPLESRSPALGHGPVFSPWPTGSYAIAFSFPGDPPSQIRWLRIDLSDGAGKPG